MTNTITQDTGVLEAEYRERSEALQALEQEQRSLQGRMRQAAETGDADRYCELKRRHTEMPARLPGSAARRIRT